MTPRFNLSGFARCAGLALALGAACAICAPLSAQGEYAQVTGNDLSRCAAGAGPSVRVQITGLKSGSGNVFVRLYRARSGDWLKAKRYLTRVDAAPRAGSMVICVPVPATGQYALAVQHDINGNRETDFSIDGAGMSNNPMIGSFLGIPRPPSVDKAAFSAGPGVTRIAVNIRYRD